MSEVQGTRWTLIGEGSNPKRALFRCSCAAKTERELDRNTVRYNGSLSCGCLRRERAIAAHSTHGEVVGGRPTAEYRAWQALQQRCYNSRTRHFKRYGGRGITVCARWRASFENFLTDMGRRPAELVSLDRIDNDGGYWCGKAECSECGPTQREPNCRWATLKQQMRNTRRAHILTHDGKTQGVSAWAEELKIPEYVLHKRLKNGWSTEDTLTTPVGRVGARRVLEVGGVTKTLKEWAKDTGISYYTLRARVLSGWLPEDVLALDDRRFGSEHHDGVSGLLALRSPS